MAMRSEWRTVGEREAVPSILDFVRQAAADGRDVLIGTDSLQCGRLTQFVTVVVARSQGHGGRAAYCREVVPRISSLRARLSDETWRSIELAMEVAPLVPGGLEVHLDVNADPAHKSSQYVQELVGLVLGQGMKAVIKPDSYAASHCADHVVRSHGKLPQAS